MAKAESRVSRHHLPRGDGGQRVKRDESYRIRLSAEEHQALRLRAAAEGVTVSRLLLDSVFRARRGPGERAALYAQFNRAAGGLGKIGGNVNQLAYWANAHQAPAAGADEALVEVRRLVAELRTAADQIVGAR